MLNICSYLIHILKGGQNILPFISEHQNSWDYLKTCGLPIYIYGMGDGALKIMSVMKEKDISVSGIFASDEFVRGHSFEGFKVKKLSEVEAEEDNFVIVLAFAAGYQSLVDKINEISERHTVLAPDVPVIDFDGEFFSLEYCERYERQIMQVYEMLGDDLSRKTFSDIINFKISGKINYLNSCTMPKDEVYEKIITPTESEIYVDLGAYRGDTIEELMSFTKGKYNKIFAVEPDAKNCAKLLKATDKMENVTVLNAAAWSSDTTLTFASKAGRQSSVSKTGKDIPARSVDSILEGKECTIIKMDVEGAEKEAIKGSECTISKFKPKLMISLYHRNEDIFSLPLMIKDINPEYKFFIRHQLYIPAWETNLYCI